MMPSTSNRILYDVPCGVCMDNSSGKHYGVFACDGCAGFFKRSVRRERQYSCKARVPGTCLINKTHRNQCRSCRLDRCLTAGMNRDAVQHERGPRNSTIRRQMALFSNDRRPLMESGLPISTHMPTMPMPPLPLPLNLSLLSNHFGYFPPFHLYDSSIPILQLPIQPLITMKSNIPPYDDPYKHSEIGARLLFSNISWIKSIDDFESLSLPDRLLLIEESWAELFILNLIHYIQLSDLKVIVERGWTNVDRRYVDILEAVLIGLINVKPDATEFIYLRYMVLFKTNFGNGTDLNLRSSTRQRHLQDLQTVAEIQRRHQAYLNIYISNTHPRVHLERACQLHQILASLKIVSAQTIIGLFFRNIIGNITIEKILTELYQCGNEPMIPLNI